MPADSMQDTFWWQIEASTDLVAQGTIEPPVCAINQPQKTSSACTATQCCYALLNQKAHQSLITTHCGWIDISSCGALHKCVLRCQRERLDKCKPAQLG